MSIVAKTEDIVEDVLVMNFWEHGEEFPAPTQIKHEEYPGNNGLNLDQINEAFHDEDEIKLEDYSVCVESIKQNILVNNALVPPTPEEEFILGADPTADMLDVARNNKVENDDSETSHNRPDVDVITLDSDSDDDGTPNNRHAIQNHLLDNDSNDKTFIGNALHEENSAADKVNNISSIVITNVESVSERSENISTHKIKETLVGENLKISDLNSLVDNEESQGNLACKNQGEVKHVFKCEICPFASKTRFSLSRHVLLHTNTNTKNTKSAAVSAKSKLETTTGNEQLELPSENSSQPKYSEKPKSNTFKCKFCSFTSKIRFALNRHILIHTNIRKKSKRSSDNKNQPKSQILDGSKCKYCSFKAKSKAGLTSHVRCLHKITNIKLECLSCHKIVKKQKMQDHKRTCVKLKRPASKVINIVREKSQRIKGISSKKVKNTDKTNSTSIKVGETASRSVISKNKPPKLIRNENASDQNQSNNVPRYQCGYCSYNTKFDSGYRRHLILHTISKQPIYRCEHCPYKTTKMALRRHIYDAHKGTNENSKDTRSAAIGVLRDSLKNKSPRKYPKKEPSYSCKECRFSSLSGRNLVRHMSSVHKSNIRIKEKLSEQTRSSESDRKQRYETRRHSLGTRSNSGGKPSKPLSNQKDVSIFADNFNNIEELTDFKENNPELLHKKINGNLDSSSILYVCEMCDFVTNKRETLIIHKATHSISNLNDKNKINSEKSEKTEQFTNDVKPKGETTNISRSENTKLTNNKPKRKCILLKNNQRRCNACKRVFVNLSGFIVHKCINQFEFNKLVKYDNESRYICKECEFSTFKIRVIQSHLVVHKSFEEAAIHKCSMCNFRSKYKSSLKTHMSRVHGNSKNKSKNFEYNCDICGFKTNHYGSIRHHKIRCHSELLTCDICGYKTYFSMVMVKHMKCIHKLEKNKDNKTDETSNEIKYKCDDCDFQTDYKHNLENHKIVHINIKEVRVYRNRTYNVRITKDNTQESSSQAKTSNNDINKRETSISTNLIMPCKNRPGIKLFSCKFCSHSTNNRNSLYKHHSMHRIKQKEQILKCDICTYSTLLPRYLRVHKRIHDTSKIYNCDHCNYSTPVPRYLRLHKKRHNTSKIYKCEYCNYISFIRSNFLHHQWTTKHYEKSNSVLATNTSDTSQVAPESIKQPTLFSCQHCEYKTNIRFKLKKHTEKSHSKRSKRTSTNLKKRCKNTPKTTLLSCNFCSFSTNSKDSLRVHHRVHRSKQSEQIFKCDICTYSTSVSSYLRAHKKRHDTSKIYNCDCCNYSSFVKSDFLTHRRIKNHYEKSNSVLATSTSVTSQVSPEPTKPPIVFSCQHCEYKTNIRFKLKKHIEKTHPKQRTLKPFQIKSRSDMIWKCDFCPYASKFKFNLNKHLPRCSYKKVPEPLSKSKTPILKCSSCFYTTKYRHALDNHFNTCHIEK